MTRVPNLSKLSATSGSAPRSLPWPNQKLCTEHQCGKVRCKLQTLHFLESLLKWSEKAFSSSSPFPLSETAGCPATPARDNEPQVCHLWLVAESAKISRKRKWHLHCENFKSGWCLASANLASFGSWTLGCQCCCSRTWKCPSAIGARDTVAEVS